MASMRSFVLHASIHFLGSEDVLTVIESNVHSIVDCVGIFALQGEDIGQKSVHTRIGHRGVTMGAFSCSNLIAISSLTNQERQPVPAFVAAPRPSRVCCAKE